MPATDEERMHIQNSLALEGLSKDEIERRRGQYAVLVSGQIESFYSTNREALKAACKKYQQGQFSVQRIEPQPVDMGFTDCANYPR